MDRGARLIHTCTYIVRGTRALTLPKKCFSFEWYMLYNEHGIFTQVTKSSNGFGREVVAEDRVSGAVKALPSAIA